MDQRGGIIYVGIPKCDIDNVGAPGEVGVQLLDTFPRPEQDMANVGAVHSQ